MSLIIDEAKKEFANVNPLPMSCLYEFEGFVLDPLQRAVRTLADGQTLRLTARAFDALHLLVSHHGQLVDKETLIKTLWPKVVVEENNLTQTIYALRQSLGEKPGEHRFIATVPGRGYQFVAAVKEVPRTPLLSTPTELSAIDKAHTGGTVSRSSLLRWGALALLLLVLPGAWWLVGRNVTSNTTSVQQAAPATSVAVLPFLNLTGDASKDYLGDGMAEELINILTKVPGLKVPARTSTFAYKGRNTDIRQIAKDLGVGTILEGSVRAADKRIRITAQLIDAQSGLHLWSESYDEEFKDIFGLQDKLATQIARALQPSLSSEAAITISHTVGTTDVEAYNLSLQGFSLLGSFARDGLMPAQALFQQAIQRDPRYAHAWAGLAAVHFNNGNLRLLDAERLEAERCARQALALDPADGHAQLVMALIAFYRNHVEADGYLRAALTLIPADSAAHAIYATQLMQVGHLRDALIEARKAYALSPVDNTAVGRLAYALALNGLDAEVAGPLATFRALSGANANRPFNMLVFRTAIKERQADTATDLLVAVAKPGEVDRASLALVVAAIVDPSKRPAAIAVKRRFYPTVPAPKSATGIPLKWRADSAAACLASYVYTLAGALDEAYDLANRCLPAQIGLIYEVLWSPEMRPFHRDPRFAAYIDRLGLHMIEYWRQYGAPDNCELQDGKLSCH